MVSRGASRLVASLATPMSPDSVASPGRRSCSAACSGRLCSSQRPTRTHANNCGCPLSGSPQAALTAAPGVTALSAHHLRAPPLSVVEQCNISLRMLDVRLRRRADPRVHVREALTRSRPVLRASVGRSHTPAAAAGKAAPARTLTLYLTRSAGGRRRQRRLVLLEESSVCYRQRVAAGVRGPHFPRARSVAIHALTGVRTGHVSSLTRAGLWSRAQAVFVRVPAV
jgi:hypothetical protein